MLKTLSLSVMFFLTLGLLFAAYARSRSRSRHFARPLDINDTRLSLAQGCACDGWSARVIRPRSTWSVRHVRSDQSARLGRYGQGSFHHPRGDDVFRLQRGRGHRRSRLLALRHRLCDAVPDAGILPHLRPVPERRDRPALARLRRPPRRPLFLLLRPLGGDPSRREGRPRAARDPVEMRAADRARRSSSPTASSGSSTCWPSSAPRPSCSTSSRRRTGSSSPSAPRCRWRRSTPAATSSTSSPSTSSTSTSATPSRRRSSASSTGPSATPLLAAGGLVALRRASTALLVFSPGFAVGAHDIQMGLAALPGVRLALALAGSLALCVVAALLARLPWMGWLRWLGEHSIVVYLAFVLPMSVSRIVLEKIGLIDDTTHPLDAGHRDRDRSPRRWCSTGSSRGPAAASSCSSGRPGRTCPARQGSRSYVAKPGGDAGGIACQIAESKGRDRTIPPLVFCRPDSRQVGTHAPEAAVIIFPGSNRDRDMIAALTKIGGKPPCRSGTRKPTLPDVDLIVLPGGFSYGDYLRSGAIAARAPIMDAVRARRRARRQGSRRLQRLPDPHRGRPPARRPDAQRLAALRLPRGEARGRQRRHRLHPRLRQGPGHPLPGRPPRRQLLRRRRDARRASRATARSPSATPRAPTPTARSTTSPASSTTRRTSSA